MKVFTIGFTKKSAEAFFTSLRKAGVKRLVDVRLNNVSQLAGFTKRDDLSIGGRLKGDLPYGATRPCPATMPQLQLLLPMNPEVAVGLPHQVAQKPARAGSGARELRDFRARKSSSLLAVRASSERHRKGVGEDHCRRPFRHSEPAILSGGSQV